MASPYVSVQQVLEGLEVWRFMKHVQDDVLSGPCPFHLSVFKREEGRGPFFVDISVGKFHCVNCQKNGTITNLARS